jgi:hypothetical protein
MTTCVFYIDESGSDQQHSIPLQGGQTPIFTLAAVALPLDQWRNFDRRYLSLKRRFFPNEMGRAQGRPEHWEVKGKELTAPRNRNSRRNHIFIQELLNLCASYNAQFFGITFQKNPRQPTPPMNLYTMGLQRLAERFHAYLDEGNLYSSGIAVLDSRERRRLDFQVAVSYNSFIFGHNTGRSLTTLQEGPLFANSRLTAGLQIVDNIAALLYANHYCYYCRRLPGALDYSHAQQYWPLLDNLQFKSRQMYSGYRIYGFYVYDFT